MFSVISKSLLYYSNAARTTWCKKNKGYGRTKVQRRGITGDDFICPSKIRGLDFLRDPALNKGLAFTLEERQNLGIQGLIAAGLRTQEQQLEFCNLSIDRYKKDLNKYLYLAELLERNERLFFALLNQNIEKFLPIVYTPTVGLACQRFGLVYRRPRGLYITIFDKGHVAQILKNWPVSDVRAVCFTDGERILGLGDLGAYGMGIPIGKLALYTALAGIKPHQCLPVMLDVGTDNEELITDPLYIGIRRKRARGKEYEDFIDEFMQACVSKYGPNTLLQFEDFALPTATPLLKTYRNRFCTFNDDIQGTAGVAVAGLYAAQKITKKKMSEQKFLFLGAGSASTGIANLSILAMKDMGMSVEEATKRMFMFDVDGLLSASRPEGIPDHAKNFGVDMPPEKNFEKVVATVKPTTLIGCSAQAGAFTPTILKMMANNCERPIIFALSNPTVRAECTAQQAYDATEGRCVFASGSPFPPVKYGGKEYITGQGNNSYIFPGIALGVLACEAHVIPEELFLGSAKALSHLVSDSDLAVGRIYPPLADVKKVSLHISTAVAEECYKLGIATHVPKPKDMKAFIQSQLYNLKYPVALPYFYDYPEIKGVKIKSMREAYSKYLSWSVFNKKGKILTAYIVPLLGTGVHSTITTYGPYYTMLLYCGPDRVKGKPAHKSYLLRKNYEYLYTKNAYIPVSKTENKNNNMEAFIRQIEKSRLYFDCWMFVVQCLFYYFIINPPN